MSESSAIVLPNHTIVTETPKFAGDSTFTTARTDERTIEIMDSPQYLVFAPCHIQL